MTTATPSTADDIIQVNGNDTVDCESRIIEDVSDLTDVQVA